MADIVFSRLPVQVTPGYDCRRDNANCPACKGEYTDDHGVNGGHLWFGVFAELEDRRVALVLDVLGNAYPPSVPDDPIFRRPPIGSALVIHRNNADGALTPGELFGDRAETCEFAGGPCVGETCSWTLADETYRTYGNNCIDPGTDYTQQSDAFWGRLEYWWRTWVLRAEVH